jgi:nitroimidazol reductase NimA-like FMN-containing flavoprotein (pyridoxamine 5'-phosphate oxidase superfamily)
MVKLPSMDEDEIEALIREERTCRIAFRGKKAPNMIPFQYLVIEGQLYFHFTNHGSARLIRPSHGVSHHYRYVHRTYMQVTCHVRSGRRNAGRAGSA